MLDLDAIGHATSQKRLMLNINTSFENVAQKVDVAYFLKIYWNFFNLFYRLFYEDIVQVDFVEFFVSQLVHFYFQLVITHLLAIYADHFHPLKSLGFFNL